jgi:uncharacterized protein
MSTPDSLFEQLSQQTHKLPPVDKWNPDQVGHSNMRIDTDGRWYYQDSEIQRPEMVRLFSTVLRRDGDRHYLVTPGERLEIDVDDAPFVAVDMEAKGDGQAQEIVFKTNVGDLVVADASHAIFIEGNPQAPRPYLRVRGGLNARISRAVYYRLVDMASQRDTAAERDAGEKIVGVWSGNEFFELGRYGA